MGIFGKMFGGTEKAKGESAHMHHDQPASGMKTEKDPICDMDVDVSKPAATSTYQGKTYYFCAPGCKKQFDQNPAKYVK